MTRKQALIKNFLKEVLQEDRESFLHDLVKFNIPQSQSELENWNHELRTARDIKRIWSKNADHEFFKSLTKIHWIGTVKQLEDILVASRKDEISTMGYLPGQEIQTLWGSFGLQVQGHVTFASNDMNALFTGYYGGISQQTKERQKSSGTSRRPGMFSSDAYKTYILDSGSFKPNSSWNNELVVDNWKPVAIVDMGVDKEVLERLERLAAQYKIPVLNRAKT